jgi:plastocyanin
MESRLLSTPRLVLAICAVAALSFAVIGGSAGARASTTIQVGDDFFSPADKTVSSGTKVKFNWVGEDKHNVVKKSGPGGDFASGSIKGSGVQFTKKFSAKGTYRIICTLHEEMKMKLKVQ